MFSLAGVGYKLTTMGKGNVMQSTAALSFCGVAAFGIAGVCNGGWNAVTWQLAVLAAAVGVFQYIGMLAFRKAMNSGPLSLVWCAVSLEFMPAVIFAALVYHEKFTFCYFLALLAVIAAIVSASFGGGKQQDGGGENARRMNFRDRLNFGLLLAALLILFGSAMMSLKFASYYHIGDSTDSLLAGGADKPFYAILYASLLVFTIIDLAVQRSWTSNLLCWTGMGLNSAGTLAAFALQLVILNQPATITFALPQSISILCASLISTLFLHEKRTGSWYATLLFSLAAIILMVV